MIIKINKNNKNNKINKNINNKLIIIKKNRIEQTYEDGEKELERTKQLRQLCEQFATVASQVGKIIISELYIPTSQKKIPPITDRYSLVLLIEF